MNPLAGHLAAQDQEDGRDHAPSSRSQRDVPHDKQQETTHVRVCPTVITSDSPPNLTMMWRYMWYNDAQIEALFLESEFERCGLRVLCYCFFAATIMFGREVMVPHDKLATMTACVMGFFLFGAGVSAVCIFVQKWEDRMLEIRRALALEKEKDERCRSSKQQSPPSPPSSKSHEKPNATADTHSQEYIEALASLLSSTRRKVIISKIHEANSTFLTIVTGLIAAYAWSQLGQESCRYVQQPFDNRDNFERCPTRMFQSWFFFTLLPVVTGQPRFHITVVCGLLNFIALALNMELHNTSKAGVMLVLLFAFGVVVAITCVKLADESNQRRRFETVISVRVQEETIKHRTATLTQFVLDITPKHLRSRLSSDSIFQVEIDRSREATCVLLDVVGVDDFMSSMLPLHAGVAIGMLTAKTSTLCQQYKLHHIRSFGDLQILVANLFRKDTPEPRQAVGNALHFCTMLSQTQTIKLRGAVAVGSLVGMPTGTMCIRYEISGQAFVEAQRALQVCEPGCVEIANGELSSPTSPTQPAPAKEGENDSEASKLRTHQNSFDEFDAIALSLGKSSRTIEVGEYPSAEAATVSSPPPEAARYGNHLPPSSSSGSASAYSDDQEIVLSAAISKHLIQTIPEINANTHRKLCFFVELEDSAVRQSARRYRQRTNYRQFLVTSGFCSICVLILLILIVVEDWALVSDDTGGQVSLLLIILSILGFAVNAAHTRSGDKQKMSLRHQVAFALLSLTTMIGASLSRPALVGESTGYLFINFSACLLHIGAPVQLVVAAQILLCISVFALGQYRPLLHDDELLLIPCLGAFVATSLAQNKLDIHAFVTLVKKQESLLHVQWHDATRESLHNALIPPAVRRRVTRKTIQRGAVDAWGIDECVVMAVNLPSFIPFHPCTSSRSVSSSLSVSLQSPDGLSNSQLPRCSSGEQVNSSQSLDLDNYFINPSDIREYLEQRSTYVEEIVERTKHRSLQVVRAFGGSILIAGPLEDASTTPSYPYRTEHAIEDMLCVAFGALQPGKFGNSKQSQMLSGTTIGVSTEQAISILKLDTFPTYDIVGPAVSIATAIAHAAPTSMVALSDKLVRFYLPDDSVQTMSGGRLKLVSCLPWKLRRWGVLRVHRLALATNSTAEQGVPLSPLSDGKHH